MNKKVNVYDFKNRGNNEKGELLFTLFTENAASIISTCDAITYKDNNYIIHRKCYNTKDLCLEVWIVYSDEARNNF